MSADRERLRETKPCPVHTDIPDERGAVTPTYAMDYARVCDACADLVLAALREPSVADEIGWLVVRPGVWPLYWAFPGEMVRDVNLATRFARRVDAEAVLATAPDCQAEEHMWVPPVKDIGDWMERTAHIDDANVGAGGTPLEELRAECEAAALREGEPRETEQPND